MSNVSVVKEIRIRLPGMNSYVVLTKEQISELIAELQEAYNQI
jgi:hypothetical protein